MAFIRFGTPTKLDVATICDICRQPKATKTITVKGKPQQVCSECAKHVNKSA